MDFMAILLCRYAYGLKILLEAGDVVIKRNFTGLNLIDACNSHQYWNARKDAFFAGALLKF